MIYKDFEVVLLSLDSIFLIFFIFFLLIHYHFFIINMHWISKLSKIYWSTIWTFKTIIWIIKINFFTNVVYFTYAFIRELIKNFLIFEMLFIIIRFVAFRSFDFKVFKASTCFFFFIFICFCCFSKALPRGELINLVCSVILFYFIFFFFLIRW